MRIAALIATESVSGPGRQLAALAAPLADEGFELHVVVLARNTRVMPPYASHLDRLGVEHTVIADGGPVDRAILGRVHECMRRLGASILQTHGYKASAAGWVLRRTRRIDAWIGFFHGSTDKGVRDRFYQAIERRMLRAADRVVVVAGAQQPTFGDGALVIPNAVIPDGSAALRAPIAAETTVKPVLGVIGRLSREKGVDVFLHACADLRSRGVTFSAVVAGDGPERRGLENLSAALGLEDTVSFIGQCEDVHALYSRIDVVVLPSRSEGLPNVLLEALAADRPVVATAVGAVPEVLSVPGSGVLVQPGAAYALADGILRALREAGAQEGAAARAIVVRLYSLEERVRRHVELYRSLVPAGSPALRSA